MRKVLYILGQLSDDDVEWLAQTGMRQKLSKGEALITQGRQAGYMYILLEGDMEIRVEGLDGALAILHAGEIMGEMSFVDSRPPSASVIAGTDCTVLAFSHDDIHAKLDVDEGFAARFYKAIATFLADRMRGTVQRLGYGQEVSLDDDVELDGELDLEVLDNVHLAGARFDRMLKRLLSEG